MEDWNERMFVRVLIKIVIAFLCKLILMQITENLIDFYAIVNNYSDDFIDY